MLQLGDHFKVYCLHDSENDVGEEGVTWVDDGIVIAVHANGSIVVDFDGEVDSAGESGRILYQCENAEMPHLYEEREGFREVIYILIKE